MTTSSTTNQSSSTNSSQQGTSSSIAKTSQYGTNTNTGSMAQNTTNSSKTGPAAAAMAILQKYGTNGLSQEDINKYMDPNLRDRLTALQNQQQANNAVQQNSLKGNAISQGALGGDRARVAQAELMRGQGLNDASALQAEREKAYTQALNMAQSDRQAALQAAGMMGTETSGTANTTGTSTSTGTSSMEGTQTSQGQFQSTGHSDTTGSSNTTSGPGGGWGMAAAVLGMLKDGGRVSRDMGGRVFRDAGGSISYAQPMAIPSMPVAQPMQFAQPISYTLPKIGNHARKKLNGMMDKLDQPGGKENAGGPKGGGGGGPISPGSMGGGSSGAAPSMAQTNGAVAAGEGAGGGASQGAAAAGEGAGAATEGAATAGEGAAAAGEGMAAAGEGAAAAGEGVAAAGEGAAAAGEGMAGALEGLAALFSDERVKENKRVIGQTFDGQHIYAFNYKGHPATQIGLMAQEVERSHPEAVGEQDGVKTVRYDVATHDAAKRGHFADGGHMQQGDYGFGRPVSHETSGLQQSAYGFRDHMQQGDYGLGPKRRVDGGFTEFDPLVEAWNRTRDGETPNVGAPGGLGALANLTAEPGARSPDAWRNPKSAPVAAWTPERMQRANLPAFQEGVIPSASAKDPSWFERMYLGAKAPEPVSPETSEADKPVIPTPAGVTSAGLRASTEADSGVLTSAPVPREMQGAQQPVKTFRVDPPASVLAPALGGTAEPGADQIAPAGAVGTPAIGISDIGMEFIKSKEGFTSRPKWDYKQNSIGYGTKALPGETSIDPDEAEARARAHADKVSAYINNNVKVPLAQNQYDALVSFGYRFGEGTLDNILQNVNKGDFKGAAERILKYRQAGGKDNEGVIARSEAEANLLLGENVATGSKPPLEPTAQGGIGKGLSSSPKTAEAASESKGISAILKKVMGDNKTTDTEKGGILKRLFGIDFNPLKLSDTERAALIAGGLGGAQAGIGAYTTMRGQDMSQTQHAAQLAETQRQHAAELGLRQQTVDQAKQSFGVIGQNPDGTPKYGFIDASAGTLKPASEVVGGPAASSAASKLHGEEYLATVDPVIAEQARRVSLGQEKMPLPSKFNPTALGVQRAVRQAYPDYNSGSYDFMQKWNDPNRGSSNNLKAANTFYQHTAELYDLTDKLPSSANGSMLNRAGVWWKNQTNDPNLAAYMDVAKQVAEEKLKTIKGGTPTKMEIEEAMKDYDPAKGKETIRRVLMQDSKLIEGRVKNLESDYNNHVSKHAPRLTALNEESQALRDKIMGKTTPSNREGESNTTARPVGVSNTQLIRKAQDAVEVAVSRGIDRAEATKSAQQQLKAMGAL